MSTPPFTPEDMVRICSVHITKEHADQASHVEDDIKLMVQLLKKMIESAAKAQKCNQITFHCFAEASKRILKMMTESMSDAAMAHTKEPTRQEDL